jgi:Mlc titration factor MtfA (ptsG expression regulator)
MFAWLRRRRRAAIRRRPFPDEWLAIMAKNVPYVGRLPREDQDALVGLVQVFLAEKHFEGCGGLLITDEVRVTIAAQACTLLLHRDTDDYPNLVSILVYPTTYVVREGRRTAEGLIAEGPEARLGESWARDVVVLAWDSVLSGAADIHDGHNVVLHEFAHQLDQENSGASGVPVLPRRSMYVAWARVLGHDFDQLVRNVAHHHRTLIDRYGATNPAEFFAVVTETFFEKPGQLRSRHPELYLQLKEFYRQDPATLGGADPQPTWATDERVVCGYAQSVRAGRSVAQGSPVSRSPSTGAGRSAPASHKLDGAHAYCNRTEHPISRSQ